jgi:hypothetical protein
MSSLGLYLEAYELLGVATSQFGNNSVSKKQPTTLRPHQYFVRDF